MAHGERAARRPPLSDQIRRARREVAGLTQEQAAARIGVTAKAYRAWELHREPRPARLRQIARAFGLAEEHFLVSPSRPAERIAESRLHELADAIQRQEDETIAALERVEAELASLRETIALLASDRTG
jgi:transcriptional regulator with XRE-family HTH domain